MDAEKTQRRLNDALRRGYTVPPRQRSLNMAAVRRSNTKPELALRRALHARGYRFRKDYPIRIDGYLIRPDIAFTRKRLAVFVDGCFWHRCPVHGQIPATNTPFWSAKLEANETRDRTQDELLFDSGWRVLRIWEHESVEDGLDMVTTALAV
jgi:DNA mismatch endonuclease (patch repair protein)